MKIKLAQNTSLSTGNIIRGAQSSIHGAGASPVNSLDQTYRVRVGGALHVTVGQCPKAQALKMN